MGLCAAEDTGINNVGLLYSKTASAEKKGEGVKTQHYILGNGRSGKGGCECYAETGREHEVLPER